MSLPTGRLSVQRKKADQDAACSEAQRVRPLTPVVLCCLTSKAEARPPRAWGSSYFTLWGKNSRIKYLNGDYFVTEGPLQIREVSQTICNCVFLFQGCRNPVLEGRHQLGFLSSQVEKRLWPRRVGTQVKGLSTQWALNPGWIALLEDWVSAPWVSIFKTRGEKKKQPHAADGNSSHGVISD